MTRTGFVDFLKKHLAPENASFFRERKDFVTRILEAESLLAEALPEKTAPEERLRDEVDLLSSVKGSLTVEVKKVRRDFTGLRAEIGLL